MNITINENLKKLRREKGNTQEELAEHLGISMQVVSKWERGEGYPDITLIPALALYYNVTSDQLLGMDNIAVNAKIQEYLEKDSEICERETYKVDRIILWREAQKEFPNNHTVLYYLINTLFWKVIEKVDEDGDYNEIIEIGERLLRESTDNSIRFNTIHNLSFCYMKHNDLENAKKYADMLPDCWNSKEVLYNRILNGEEAIEYNQRAIISYVQLVCNFAGSLWINMQKIYSKNEIIKVLEFTLNLYRLVYPDGDFNDEIQIYYNLYNLACFNFSIGNNDKAFLYFEEMPEHFIKTYTNNNLKHTSFLVNKLNYGYYQMPKGVILNEINDKIKEFENQFGDLGNDERYTTALEKMKTLLET